MSILFLDSEGFGVLGDHRRASTSYLQRFKEESGVSINQLPTPEDNSAKLGLALEMLRGGSTSPAVYGIDTIWSGALGDYLVDLLPYLGSQIPSHNKDFVSSYTVHGRLIAIPYHPNVQVLYYRTDLLSKYGYRRPPRSWPELERMALRIQQGERKAGNKLFWGFVWSGAVASESEQLTCEGLEWQAAEGGGTIIEPDSSISVNNQNVRRAWERAARWVGWISPPSITSYTALDAENEFWVSGRAAFQLGWTDLYELHAGDKPFRDRAGVTSVPRGSLSRVSTLGGYALGISRSTAHLDDCLRFVEFLIRKQSEFIAAGPPKLASRKVEYVEVPAIMRDIYPWWCKPGDQRGSDIVSRPSAVAGARYEAVSQAYSHALHSVLTRESTAPRALASLEQQLVQLTGFRAGAPGADAR